MSYRLSRQFILRVAGLPIEELARLRSPELAAAADAGDARPVYAREIERLRHALMTLGADQRFRQALLLSAPELERLTQDPSAPLRKRTSDRRHHEHTLVRYAQRLAAKNDTISAFGPSAWGRIDPDEPGTARLQLADGVDRRVAYLERWVCEALAERMPSGALEPAEDLIFDEPEIFRGGSPLDLDHAERELLRRADGTLPDPGPPELCEQLLAKGLLVRRLRVPVSAAPFEALVAEVERWPTGEERSLWMRRFAALETQRAAFENGDLDGRRAALSALGEILGEAGVPLSRRSRALYAARLPLSEDCRRATSQLVLGAPFVEQAAGDLAPWYDLWRDLAGLYATRIGEGLGAIWSSLGEKPVPLERFFHACRDAGIDLWRGGGAGLAPELYDQIQEAWQEQLGSRAGEREVSLTGDDLSFLRRRFQFSRMRAFDHPAPDLQILAPDVRAVEEGRWQLLVGEIHPEISLWENCFMLFCPEAPEAAFPPAVTFGPPTELGVHILCRAFEHAEWSFLRPLFANGCASIARGAALVDRAGGDLVIRDQRRSYGSLVHNWRVAGNTHRLELVGTAPHSPRLKVGRAIVQRESWRLEPDDALRAQVAQVGPGALVALRSLRRKLSLPEEVFVRPELPLRHSYFKDAKPLFIDFQNPFLLEVLGAWIRRYLRLRVTEMLPAPSDLWLADSTGHYGFELRLAAYSQGSPSRS